MSKRRNLWLQIEGKETPASAETATKSLGSQPSHKNIGVDFQDDPDSAEPQQEEMIMEITMVDEDEVGAAERKSAMEFPELSLDAILGPVSPVIAEEDSHEEATMVAETMSPEELRTYERAVSCVLCPLLEESGDAADTAEQTNPLHVLRRTLQEAVGVRTYLTGRERQMLYQFIVAQCELNIDDAHATSIDSRVFNKALKTFVQQLRAQPASFSSSDMSRYVSGFVTIVRAEVEKLRPALKGGVAQAILGGLLAAADAADRSSETVRADEAKKKALQAKMVDRLMVRFRTILSAEKSVSTGAGTRQLSLLRAAFGVAAARAQQIIQSQSATSSSKFVHREIEEYANAVERNKILSLSDFKEPADYDTWKSAQLQNSKDILTWLAPRVAGPSCTLTVTLLAARGLSAYVNSAVYVEVVCGGRRWESHPETVLADSMPQWQLEHTEMDAESADTAEVSLYVRKMIGTSLLGSTQIKVRTLPNATPSEQWVQLGTSRDAPEVHLRLVYADVKTYSPSLAAEDALRTYQVLLKKLLTARPKQQLAAARVSAVQLTAEGKNILKQYALRYGNLSGRQQALSMIELLLEQWHDTLDFYSALEETIRQYSSSDVPLPRAQETRMFQLLDDVSRTIRSRITSYHSIFFQNQPHGALQKACEVLRLCNNIRPEKAISLVDCIKKAHMKEYESTILQSQGDDLQSVSGIYSPRQLLALCNAVLNCVYTDSSYFDRAFPPEIPLVQLSAVNYFEMLLETVETYCRSFGDVLEKGLTAEQLAEIFPLYFKLLDVQDRLADFTATRDTTLLTQMFQPFIRVYLKQLSDTMCEWVRKACDLDQWKPTGDALHSSSVTDMFAFIRQAFALLKDFQLPCKLALLAREAKPDPVTAQPAGRQSITTVELTVEGVMELLSVAVGRVIKEYIRCASEIARANPAHADSNAQSQWVYIVPSTWCTVLNNLETSRSLVMELREDFTAHLTERAQKENAPARQLLEINAMKLQFDGMLSVLAESIRELSDSLLQDLAGPFRTLTDCAVADSVAVQKVLDDDDAPKVKMPSEKHEYLRAFRLPRTEEYQKDFACTFFSRRGLLVLFDHYVVFGTVPMSAAKVIIPMKDIVRMQKVRLAGKTKGHAISIETNDGQSMLFSAFPKRDKAFEMIEKQAAKAGTRIQILPADTIEDGQNALSEPLLSFLDSMLFHLREQLYLQLFRKILLMFWQQVIHNVLDWLAGALSKGINEEQRSLVERMLVPLYDFFYAEGHGLSERFMKQEMANLKSVLRASFLNAMANKSADVISMLPQLEESQRKFADQMLRVRAAGKTKDPAAAMYVRDQDTRKQAEETVKRKQQQGRLEKAIQIAMNVFSLDG